MLELDDMERSSAKHDPLLFFILLVTGFRIIALRLDASE